MKTNNQRDHDQFMQWWRKQAESSDRHAMKLAWKVWKASKRHTLANESEDKRQVELDTMS
jgi:hypothetical protein